MGTCKNRLAEAVLTSTHNLCFGAKIRKNLKEKFTENFQFLQFQKNLYMAWASFHNVIISFECLRKRLKYFIFFFDFFFFFFFFVFFFCCCFLLLLIFICCLTSQSIT